MPNYQIKLTPVDTFFFGGEKHKLNDKNELAADYFVESNPYPQQTTMLGMLRYYLLYRSGNLIFPNLDYTQRAKRKEAALTLIGKRSFALNGTNEFGKIQSISPLYFLSQNKAYHFAPFDCNFKFNNNALTDNKGKPYNAKDHHYPISKQRIINGTDLLELSELIKDVEHTGNKKAKQKGESKSEGFYKMKKKQFKRGWSFAFHATIDMEMIKVTDEFKIPYEEAQFVPFGGEKSIFKIEFKRVDPFHNPTVPTNYKREAKTPFLHLTSDAFVKNKDLKAVDFAVNQFVSFRCMQSTIETANYNALPKLIDKNGNKIDKEAILKTGLFRSCRFQLLKRGSILYFKNENEREELEKKLNTPEHQFGFNHYLKN